MHSSATRYRCRCCGCHTLEVPEETAAVCTLCRWDGTDAGYALDEACTNARAYGVYYRPADVRFAPARHPILGVRGEYAVDRVALRERACAEFAIAGKERGASLILSDRLLALLACVRNADRLYAPRG